MATTKEALAQVLQALDHKNDTQWTEDGAPLVSVVQKLANDKTITREAINDALPGFVRSGTAPKTEVNQDMKVTDTPPIGAEKPDAPEAEFDPGMEPEINGAGEPLSEDEVRAILNRRIRDAETNLSNARKAQAEANAEVLRCEQRLNRAHTDHNRQFPPITEAANIKAHLASQSRLAMQRAGLLDADGNPTTPPAKTTETNAFMRSTSSKANSRGWTRPPVNGLTGVQRSGKAA